MKERLAPRTPDDPLKPTLLVLMGLLLLIAAPNLLYETIRIGYTHPIDYNEGWNLIHTMRFLQGGPLYPKITTSLPVIPVNYPPLSFVLIGGIDWVTRAPLVTGRAVSLLSMLVVGALVYGIVVRLTGNKGAAGVAAALWLALMARRAADYVGMYDPQLLGHVFSVGALYLYTRLRERPSSLDVAAPAVLCTLGLFVKQLLVAVPITLAIALWTRDRRQAAVFALAGVATAALLLSATWLIWGDAFFSNLSVEGARHWNPRQLFHEIGMWILSPFGAVLAWMLIILWLIGPKTVRIGPLYLLISIVVGAFAKGGGGVDVNAWFDALVAASIVTGSLAAYTAALKVSWARYVLYGLLVAFLLARIPHQDLRGELTRALVHPALQDHELAYRNDVQLLRSIQGPALFDTPLLGYAAGKDYLFDPFFGTRMVLAGRIPERMLIDRIRHRYFTAVVFSFDLGKRLQQFPGAGYVQVPVQTMGPLTDNTLLAINQCYVLLDSRGPHFFFTYVPRTPSSARCEE